MKLYGAWSSFLQNWDRRIINKFIIIIIIIIIITVLIRDQVRPSACARARVFPGAIIM